MITLFNKSTNEKMAYLDDVITEDSIQITRKINGEFNLSFELLEDDLKSIYLESEGYILCDGYCFDIKYIEKEHSDTLTYRIECEHASYRLIEDEVEYYTYDGTPTQILTNILLETEFTPGEIDSIDFVTFAVYEETNKLGLLQKLANLLNLEIDYVGFTISLKNTIGENKGFATIFGKNLKGIKKIIDRRNNLTYYDIDLVELKNHPDYEEFKDLEEVGVGDTIRIIDRAMNIDLLNKVVKTSYNPIKSINSKLEIANSIELLTDKVTKIQRDTLAKGKTYHGIRISPDTGFESIRSDKLARGIFNSDTFALQSGDGSGENWTSKLYFDPLAGKYIFDGVLSAGMIEALEAEFDVTISNITITNVLAADKGYIAELTVDQLETSNKVQKYLGSDTSDVDYIKIQGEYVQFITASTDGSAAEQAKDRRGTLLYWKDSAKKAVTTDITIYPVTVYVYEELVKMDLRFIDDGSLRYPIIQLGAGSSPEEPDRGKGFIFKDNDGLQLKYVTQLTGKEINVQMTNEGFVDADMRRLKSATINRIDGTIQTLAEGKTTGDEDTITFVETSSGITYTWPDGFVTTVSIS